MSDDIPDGYKVTEVGMVPEGWEVKTVQNVVIKTEQVDPHKKPNWLFKYIDISGISRDKLKIEDFTEYKGENAPSRARKLIKTNDIIFSTVRPYLKQISLVPESFDGHICSTGFCVIRCKSSVVDYRFIFQCATSDAFIGKITTLEVGSNYPAIANKDVLNRLIPLPPLPEQRRIAEILSVADETIERTGALIAKYRQIKAGLMTDLLTSGIDEAGRRRSEETHEFKDSPRGMVPEGWDVNSLNLICDKIQDGTHFSPKSKNGPCRYITSKNIKFGKLDISNCEYISEEEHEQIYKICPVKFGDVLLTKDGANTGNAAINDITEPFSLLSSVAILRSNPEMATNRFILQYILSPSGQKLIKDSMSGLAITRMTLVIIKSLKIPLPPLPEQRRIAEILSSADDRIEKEERYRDKLLQIKKGLMQDLLTGKVRTKAGAEA